MLVFRCFYVFFMNHVCFYHSQQLKEQVLGGYHVTEDRDVEVLTGKNFDSVIKANKIMLVMFYAPWCRHYNFLTLDYESAAQSLKKEDPPILLAKVDVTVEDGLAKRFKIHGFCNIFLFINGEKKEYDGPTSASGIVKYMKKEADPSYQPFPSYVARLTHYNFTQWIKKQDLTLVVFYINGCRYCKRLELALERAAFSLLASDIKIAKIDANENKKLADKYEVKKYPDLLIFHRIIVGIYQGPMEEKGIVKYMKDYAQDRKDRITIFFTIFFSLLVILAFLLYMTLCILVDFLRDLINFAFKLFGKLFTLVCKLFTLVCKHFALVFKLFTLVWKLLILVCVLLIFFLKLVRLVCKFLCILCIFLSFVCKLLSLVCNIFISCGNFLSRFINFLSRDGALNYRFKSYEFDYRNYSDSD